MKKQAKFFIVFVFFFLMLLSSCGTILEFNSNPKTDNKETEDDSNKKEDEKKDDEDKDNPSDNENIDDPDEPNENIDDPDDTNDDNEEPIEPDEPTPIDDPVEPEEPVEEVTFVVTFMDGEVTLKIEHIKENGKIKVFTPTKVNYQFFGWYKDSQLTKSFDINTPITETQNLYAKWEEVAEQEALTHEITFMDGDDELRSLTIESGNKIFDYKPNKVNHTFLGWYKDSTLTEAFDLNTIITESQVLFAKWKANTFTIIFMDGNTELKREIVNSGKTITPYEPEKAHYGFDSWHLDEDLTELFDENEKITSNITLYAKWIKDSYKVTFIDDGEVLKNIIIEYGDKIQAYTPEKKHYSFAGWYFDSSFNDAFSYNDLIDSDSLLYAKWEKTIYDVIYLDGDSEIKTEQIESGKKAKEFEPEKDNFSFIGWYADEALTTSFDFDDEILSNTTLYSKWYDLVNFETIGSTTRVGMNYKINGYVERKLPIVSNEGSVSVYPEWFTAYPSNYNDSDYISLALENLSLISSDTNYNYMDKDGNLYLRNSSGELTPTGKTLYKHTASLTMYTNPDLADRTKAYIPDDEPAVSKTINIYDPKLLGNYVTGLYAQPGEVIEINISEEDLKKIGSLTVWIGNRRSHEFFSQSATDEKNISDMKSGKRMPIIHQSYVIKESKGYIGSFFGGPIYIEPANKVSFSVTINGALEYLHYIDGLTTKDEFERLEKTNTPYFDFEIFDTGARFSGPRYTINPIKGIENGVTSLDYDNYVNVAEMWSCINEYSLLVPHGRDDNINIEMCYETTVLGGLAMAYVGANFCRLPIGWMSNTLSYKSFMRSGGWGVIHEYNHHHQKYGANGSSNEVTNNIVNYMEYIMFTNMTAFRNYGTSGHEVGLSSHYDIEYLNQYYGTDTKLNEEKGYALLVQNFGPLNFLKVAQSQAGMNLNDSNYTVRYTNWYIRLCNTLEMDFTYLIQDLWHLDLDSDAVAEIKAKKYPVYLPVGSFYATNFQFTNKSSVLNSNNALPYYCNSTITLDLANDINVVNGCTVEILNVGEPTHGTLTYDTTNNKYLYQNTTGKTDSFDVEVKVKKDDIEEIVIITMSFKPINSYISVETYEMGNDTYSDIRKALDDDFSKATSKTISQSTSQKISGIKQNTITKVSGSFISTYDGTYDLCYRGGRGSSIMYAGVNTKQLEEIGYITINQSAYQFDSNAHANKEITLHKGDIVYYEIYLLATSNDAWLEMGLSKDRVAVNVIILSDSLFGSFDGNYIKDIQFDIPNKDYVKTYSLNVDITLDYSDYEATSERFEPWDSTNTLDKIFDDNTKNYAHSKKEMYVSESDPMDLIVDLKKEETFNAISVEAYNSQNYTPRKFDIYFSDDGIEFTLVKSVDTPSGSDRVNLVKFDEYQTTRYIKFIFKDSNGGKGYFALSGIKLKCIEEFNLDQWNPDIAMYYGNVIKNNVGFYGHGYSMNAESRVDFNALSNRVIFKSVIDSNEFKVLVNNKVIEDYELITFADGYNYLIVNDLNNDDLVSIINLDGEIKIYSISS